MQCMRNFQVPGDRERGNLNRKTYNSNKGPFLKTTGIKTVNKPVKKLELTIILTSQTVSINCIVNVTTFCIKQ